MPSYDVEARIDILKTATKSQLYGRLDADQTVGEVTVYDPYTVPNTASDLAIPFGSVGTASALYLETNSSETLQYKLSGSGNTGYTLSNGFILIKGGAITSLHVSIPGSVDIDLTVLVVE